MDKTKRNLFLERYNLQHQLCPNCGSKQCQETLMGTILNLEHSQKYEDSNICICSGCDMNCVIDPSKEWSQQRMVQSIGQQIAKEVDQELVEYKIQNDNRKYDTIRQQLSFINNTIQSHCMEKDGNLVYFYIQEVARKFAEATDMARLQLSSIVYDINLKKTVKSRWHNLTNVYFDFLNKQFYMLEN